MAKRPFDIEYIFNSYTAFGYLSKNEYVKLMRYILSLESILGIYSNVKCPVKKINKFTS